MTTTNAIILNTSLPTGGKAKQTYIDGAALTTRVATSYATKTASGTITATSGYLCGFVVNATSSGVMKIRDGGAAGAIVVGGSTGLVLSAAADSIIVPFPFDIPFATDIYFELVSGTAEVTFYYR